MTGISSHGPFVIDMDASYDREVQSIVCTVSNGKDGRKAVVCRKCIHSPGSTGKLSLIAVDCLVRFW